MRRLRSSDGLIYKILGFSPEKRLNLLNFMFFYQHFMFFSKKNHVFLKFIIFYITEKYKTEGHSRI